METKSGIIQGVAFSEGVNEETGQPWQRWGYEIDGKKYSTFDKKIGDKFKLGDNVIMTGEQKGQYWNMKTMELNVQAGGLGTPSEVPVVKPGEIVMCDREGKTMFKNPAKSNAYPKDPIGLVIELMVAGQPVDTAISNVKRAQEAFI